MTNPFDDLSSAEDALWNSTFGSDINDGHLDALFHEAYFNPGAWDKDELSAIRTELHDYLQDYYDIDFDEVFDWDAWREAYSGTGE